MSESQQRSYGIRSTEARLTRTPTIRLWRAVSAVRLGDIVRMARSSQCTVVNQVAGFVAEREGNRLYEIMVVFVKLPRPCSDAGLAAALV